MASYTHFVSQKKIRKSVCEKLSRNVVFLHHIKLAINRDPKAAKMILQTYRISSKQSELKILSRFFYVKSQKCFSFAHILFNSVWILYKQIQFYIQQTLFFMSS